MEWEKEKFGRRISASQSGDKFTIDIRDIFPTTTVYSHYCGKAYYISPAEAVELGRMLASWGEHQLTLRRAARRARELAMANQRGFYFRPQFESGTKLRLRGGCRRDATRQIKQDNA